MIDTYSTCYQQIITEKIIMNNKSTKKYLNKDYCCGRINLVENKYLVCEKCDHIDLVSNQYPPFEINNFCTKIFEKYINALYQIIHKIFS